MSGAKKKVAVIGGGAAGMLAAGRIARGGCSVTLFERNSLLGKKLGITGKGRCNFTNACSPDDFLSNVSTNKNFLKGAAYRFSSEDTLNLFTELGLNYKIERGNRVFPSSDKASDVTKTLKIALEKSGVKILYNTNLKDILVKNGKIDGVITNEGKIFADALILATGGASYPTTGSDGETFNLLKKLGIEVVKLKPSLVGIELKGDFYKKLQGLSLKNVTLTLKSGDKTVYSELGEMLFTHFGVSGPLCLTASSYITKYQDLSSLKLFIDLKPALDEDTLKKRILRDFEENKGKNLYNSLVKLSPSSLIKEIVYRAGLKADSEPFNINKEQMTSLIKAYKEFYLPIKGLRGLDEAIVTSGGVDVKEINPKTMECKKIAGLYFAGEMIDVDAFTGGFNIQIAFSTGFLAGTSAGA